MKSNKKIAIQILDKYLDSTDVTINKDIIVNAMNDYAEFRLHKFKKKLDKKMQTDDDAVCDLVKKISILELENKNLNIRLSKVDRLIPINVYEFIKSIATSENRLYREYARELIKKYLA